MIIVFWLSFHLAVQVESPARFDLMVKGKGSNPHRPVAIDIVRIPLLSRLDKKAMKIIDPLMKVNEHGR